MASTNINVNDRALVVLKRAKKPGQSFSDVILEYIRPPSRTAGELLEELERNWEGVAITTHERLQKLREGRGRRATKRRVGGPGLQGPRTLPM